MTILLTSLAVLIPILTLPFWLFYFDITPKVAALLFGTAIACGYGIRHAQCIRDLWRARKGRTLIALLALQAAALLIAWAVSRNPQLSYGGSTWRFFGVVTQLALLVLMLLTAAGIATGLISTLTLLRGITVSGAAIALYAILQYFGWDPLLPSATYHIGEGEWTIVRPPGTLGHADYLGTYLVFILFLAWHLVRIETAPRWKRFAAVAIALSGFAIVLSGTRSAMLGTAIGVALLLYRLRPSWKHVALTTAVAAISLTIFYVSPYGIKLRGRARWAREDVAGGARLLLWRDSARMAVTQWTGFGPETFSAEFPRFQSLELARAYPDFYHESPHNIFLDEWAGKGILGLLAFSLWTGFGLLAAFRAIKNGAHAALGATFIAALVSLQFNAFILPTAFFFFLIIVLLAALETEPALAEPAAKRWQWFAAVPALALAALFTVFAVRLCVADVLLSQTRAFLEAGGIVGAAVKYEAVRKWQVREGASDLYYSRNVAPGVKKQADLLLAVKAWQEAVQAGIRATRLADDRHNAWYHLASLYAQVNNHDETERCLRAAIDASPTWFKPHWLLAQVLRARGKLAEARTEAEAAVDRDAGKHPEVTETLNELRRTGAATQP